MRTLTHYLLLVFSMSLIFSSHALFAEEPIYGHQLMTEQERIEYRAKIQNMKTVEERERYRMEHHTKMQQLARERGVTLPDMPQPKYKSIERGFSGHGAGNGHGSGGSGRTR